MRHMNYETDSKNNFNPLDHAKPSLTSLTKPSSNSNDGGASRSPRKRRQQRDLDDSEESSAEEDTYEDDFENDEKFRNMGYQE